MITPLYYSTDTGRKQTESVDIKRRIISGKEYIIKSVYIGNKDIKTALLKLAEKKTIKQMGLDN